MGVNDKKDEAKTKAEAVKTAPKKQQSVGNISEEIEDDLSTLPNMKISETYFLVQHQYSSVSTIPASETKYSQELIEFIQQNSKYMFIFI
jgi:hypothetical protein